MTRDELRQLVAIHLDRTGDPDSWSGQPGAVLYSGLASLRPGRFYLLGINPGGMDDMGGPVIRENLCADDGTNHYADQHWEGEPGTRSVLQKRVCDLIDALGVAPQDVPSTNLIFRCWPQIRNLPDRNEWRRRCWGVHEHLLRLVKPRWIISLGYGGYDAFEFLKPAGPERQKQAAKTAWYYEREMDFGEGPQPVGVLGVAHPGKQGFVKLNGAERYPDDLKAFIARYVRPGEAEAGS
ncbi:hypothetical protein J8J14_24185 [Roseomonas sp. SSH11]|uniref:Uracil-DNA glycosylase-like domain-containing protein n=1 Tax=Pararoseomonas baculiformis TaxID=2820812 RepID=A0ABS4ALF5_9PROT|nr:uracil-DNA glycosylase family protein [Pararoseomonas baculiformis]MBP0447841.1 hypothetical protein [Pararoseomonas baculiformis]